MERDQNRRSFLKPIRHDQGVVDDRVGALVHLVAVPVKGTELAIGGEEVRVQLRDRSLAGMLRIDGCLRETATILRIRAPI